MVFKIIICAVQEKARERERETYQFHGCSSGVGGGGWVSRKRLERGVAAEIGGERERKRPERE
ncbi:hypothetical protein TIFTF001_035787 [Ficus carica]|uniref:Uncharacterized protein n=1 Tax=Ficus carica TaxID=3494 RepID=A0AA88E2Z0_FICCA|nr:hypothetical protein TIFTF001_035787 [Ficus carica]